MAARAQPSPAGEWHIASGDYANTRYSPLAQITAANVARLQPVFTFATGLERGHEAAPIVADGTLFVVGPYPNPVFAFDLTQPGFARKWKFDPAPHPSAQGVACCDTVNRGAAYADGRLFFNTLDNQTVALDAKTGRELWRFDTEGHRLESGKFGFDRRTIQSSPAAADGRWHPDLGPAHRSVLDPVVPLAYVAGQTDRIRLGTAISTLEKVAVSVTLSSCADTASPTSAGAWNAIR